MAKQTAIEWLIQELRGYDDKGDFIFNGVINSELIEQAKQMEKEQIICAVLFGVEVLFDNGDIENKNRAEQYYNKTFKQ